MKVSSFGNSSVQTPAVQLARLSGPHGYRFEGDLVHLNAMFALLDPAAHERSWALQLWACPAAPASARDLAGHIVAEVFLPPMGELADENEHFDVSAFAWPPAGAGEHVMVLVLASGHPGHFNDVHDLAVYPRAQEFVQPRMTGSVGYRMDGAQVQLFVDRVENPRAEENRSGTLSLELWALPAPFVDERFLGHQLAGVEIGTINGQSELELPPVDLTLTPPPAGKWQIVLMLREWTAAGFVTRDFANFDAPFVTATAVVENTSAPVVEKPVISPAKKAVALLVEKTPARVSVIEPASEVGRAVVPVAPAKGSAKSSAKGVSVNTARVEELAAVKGLTTKLAQGIVKKRPFTSLDDLREVKGIGAKILAKVRASLKL